MVIWIEQMSAWIVPIMVLFILFFAFIKRNALYDNFLAGVRETMGTVVTIFPAILAIYIAVAMLKTSGLLGLIEKLLYPFMNFLHMPCDVLPLAILRPVSGSGAIALVDKIFTVHGPDSLTGITAAVMSAATETTFYTLAMYFGAAKIQKTSYALPASLTADIVSVILSVFVCRWLFFKG